MYFGFHLPEAPASDFFVFFTREVEAVFSWEDLLVGIEHSPGFSETNVGGWVWVYPQGTRGRKIARMSLQVKPRDEIERLVAMGIMNDM